MTTHTCSCLGLIRVCRFACTNRRGDLTMPVIARAVASRSVRGGPHTAMRRICSRVVDSLGATTSLLAKCSGNSGGSRVSRTMICKLHTHTGLLVRG